MQDEQAILVFLREQNEGVTQTALALRDVVRAALPEAVESLQIGHGNVLYSLNGQMMKGGVVYIAPLKDSVNLGFMDGVDLAERSKLLKGTGKRLRHIKLKSIEEVQQHRAEIESLLETAWEIKA